MLKETLKYNQDYVQNKKLVSLSLHKPAVRMPFLFIYQP